MRETTGKAYINDVPINAVAARELMPSINNNTRALKAPIALK